MQQVIRSTTYKFCIDQKNCFFQYFCSFSFLLYETLNRSDRLFYPLIFYNTAYLCILSNKPSRLFYFLVLSRLAYLLCKILNKLNRLFYPLTHTGPTICNQPELGGDYRHGIYTTKVLAIVLSICLLVWSADFIATLILRRLEDEVLWV